MGKGKKKTQADVPTPSVAPVIQKKGAGKPKCTSSEIDDIFGVAKSASAAIPPPAPSIPHAEQANASSSPQQKPTKRPKPSSSTAPDEGGEEEEDDITDDLQLLAERIRKNRQDKANKVSSHGDQCIQGVLICVLSSSGREAAYKLHHTRLSQSLCCNLHCLHALLKYK